MSLPVLFSIAVGWADLRLEAPCPLPGLAHAVPTWDGRVREPGQQDRDGQR